MGRSIAKVFSGFFDSVFLEWFCCLDLGCDVVGLVSSPRGPTQHVTQYYTGGELSGMMSGLDYLINVLPATQETNNLLTRYIIRYIDRGFKQILEKTSNIARMSASSILVVGTSSVRRTFCLLLTTTSSAEPSLTSLIWSRFLKIPLCGLTKTSWVWTIWLNLCRESLFQSRLTWRGSPELRMLPSASSRISVKILMAEAPAVLSTGASSIRSQCGDTFH